MAAVSKLALYGGPQADLSGAGASVISIAVSGTSIPGMNELAVRAGGRTIILTVANDTWVAAGGTFNAQRQNIIDGLTSNGAESTGWNNIVRDANFNVEDVVRTSNTVVTLTMPVSPTYDIINSETVTVTVPASALTTQSTDLVANPTFGITPSVINIGYTRGPKEADFAKGKLRARKLERKPKQ